MAGSSIAKTRPKSFIFPVAFHGKKGGLHYVKMRFILDGIIQAADPTHQGTKEQVAKAKERAIHRNMLLRFVNWYEKATGTNYGRGRFRGILVYKLSSSEAINHPKIKKGWTHAGMKFWVGD